MNIDNKFYKEISKFKKIFKEIEEKSKNKYKYKKNDAQVNYKVYKSPTKYSIEFPTVILKKNKKKQKKINESLNNYLISNMLNKFDKFYPLINSISFKFHLELDLNLDIKSCYYKTAFFKKSNENVIIRILPSLLSTNSFMQEKDLMSIDETFRYIFKKLYLIDIDDEFSFDEEGVELIKMLII